MQVDGMDVRLEMDQTNLHCGTIPRQIFSMPMAMYIRFTDLLMEALPILIFLDIAAGRNTPTPQEPHDLPGTGMISFRSMMAWM